MTSAPMVDSRITEVGATPQVLEGGDDPFRIGAITPSTCKVIHGKYGIKKSVTWYLRAVGSSGLNAGAS